MTTQPHSSSDGFLDLDTEWVHAYTTLDSIDSHKIREPMTNLNVYYVFIDLDNSIQHIECEKEPIVSFSSSPSSPPSPPPSSSSPPPPPTGDLSGIHKDRLLQMIHNKKMSFSSCSSSNSRNVRKYTLLHLLFFHVDIEPEHISDFITRDAVDSPSSFLHEHISISDLVVPPSLFIFHDVNALFVFLRERSSISKTMRNYGANRRVTKKVRFVNEI